MTLEPADGDRQTPEVSVLSCHRVSRQAQELREQLTDLRTLLDGKMAPAPIQAPVLDAMERKLLRLQEDLQRLIDNLKSVEQPLDQTLQFVPVVEAVLSDTIALIVVLDGLRTAQDAAR